MKRKMIQRAMAGFCIGILLTGCGTGDSTGAQTNAKSVESTAAAEQTQEQAAETEQTAASAEENDGAEEQTAPAEAADYMTIATDFGDIYYPDQWMEFIQIDQTTEGDVLTLLFNARVKDKEFSLFHVVINGEGDNGGLLTDANGETHKVSIEMMEIEDTEGLSSEEQDRLYAMQEDVNYIIEHLK
ncbi:MAG: hypothetical protein Q4B22_05620 [Eubacteriales bacterium]|nr:hypothetical protein [Eubacteriales bacterium]